MLALSHQRKCVNTKITSITGERLSQTGVLQHKIMSFDRQASIVHLMLNM